MLGIIGGSGIYSLDGLTNTHWKKIASPFGEPSDELLFGDLNGNPLVFLPRHGRGHKLSPSGINYLANIDVLKRVGVTDLISISAVGSLRENLPPGKFVIVDQFIDRTVARPRSFFGNGCVSHISMAHPICHRLSKILYETAIQLGIDATLGGTYLVIEGPQFSTYAESQMYRQWGCDVIGMTNLPEAKLAREAEMCYTTIAMVTDYDCWHPDHDNVTVQQIVETFSSNAAKAQKLLQEAIPVILADASNVICACRQALEASLITDPKAQDPELIKKLDAILGRLLK